MTFLRKLGGILLDILRIVGVIITWLFAVLEAIAVPLLKIALVVVYIFFAILMLPSD